MRSIDLNADLGELPGPGGSALDAAMLAAELSVAPGAHVSYPDRAGFGRRDVALTPAALRDTLEEQLALLTWCAGWSPEPP